jgi:ribulose-5-phosphate 4-epimerase/fuculose-1-phosphate aldolase
MKAQQKLFEEIDVLPINIKTELIDRVLTSINSIDKNTDDFWINESNKRIAEIKSSSINLVDGKKVFEKISNRLKN